MLQPVILCGGSGTRLWPLSRKAFPKQFAPLIHGNSLLRLALERVASLTDKAAGVLCVGADDYRFLVLEAITATGPTGPVILEPCACNTAAAMAALLANSRDQLLLFCPADHHISDAQAFASLTLPRGHGRCRQRRRLRAARNPGAGSLPLAHETRRLPRERLSEDHEN
jgi:mannose-1-phosphate guanylyltransferase/mannose-6-phosphate isomerase